jgi:Zn-dependent protease
MRNQIRLGRVFGIDIGLHYSWFAIAVLITLSLVQRFRLLHPGWAAEVVWGTALITVACFFASILVHELSHALVARARRLRVRSITLFALGGVARIEQEAADPRTEFWMGIAGPATSALIGAGCLGLARVTGTGPLAAMFLWLG